MFKIAFSLYGRRAGVITRDGGRVQLSYDPDYLSQPTATPLSLSLPLSATPHLNRPIEAYLRGLLPDNTEVRRRWAQTFGLRDRDTLGLIRAIGMDCAGGALFALEDELQSALERPGEVESLTDAQIGAHLRLLRSDEAAWHEDDEDHWSLAGGQSKFTLVKTSDGWGRARGSAPSTHIIKPGIGRIPAQALIEHVSMRALALLGLPVAASVYHEFNSEPAIVVERFDRHLATDGSVVRLHSEDFLQAFGMDPSRKYESDGGPGVARVATLLAATTDGSSHERFMQAVIANYLLGAPDAHAKNYSLLLAQRQVSLAPLYDIASGLASESITGNLRYRKAAMSIGGETLFGEVTGRNWDKFAIIVQQDRDKVRATVTRLATQLPDALHDTIKELPPRVAGRPVLTKQILPRLIALAAQTLKGLDAGTGRTIRSFFNTLD